MESIGNDFVLVTQNDLGSQLDSAVLERLAIQACTRRWGVGSDGLLVVDRAPGGVTMRMFNPDGTEDFCGNGLRCAARFAVDSGWVGTEFQIEHLREMVPVKVSGDRIETIISPASFDPLRVPLLHSVGELFQSEIFLERIDKQLRISSLTTGSTHTVLFVDRLPSDEEIQVVGPALEHHPFFPKRTSVIWAVIEGESLRIRIWERGAGETLGCGTGSSAAAAVFCRIRGRGGIVEVRNRGGTVIVEMESWDSPIRLSGSAHLVFQGVFDFLD